MAGEGVAEAVEGGVARGGCLFRLAEFGLEVQDPDLEYVADAAQQGYPLDWQHASLDLGHPALGTIEQVG